MKRADVHISILDTACPSVNWSNTPIFSTSNCEEIFRYGKFTQRDAESGPETTVYPAGSHPPLFSPLPPPPPDPSSAPAYNHEFLAYGVIKKPAYTSVPYSKISAANLWELFQRIPAKQLTDAEGKHFVNQGCIMKSLPIAKKIGRLFGDGFDVPVMAHLMGCIEEHDVDHDRIVGALSSEFVHEKWYDLLDADPGVLEYKGHTEALRGAQILRDTVIQQFGNVQNSSTKEMRIAAEKKQRPEEEEAVRSMKEDPRVSSDVKERAVEAVRLCREKKDDGEKK